jgi:unsaturated rhamnogalacturonyl hydrolase
MADSALKRYSIATARWHYEHGLLVQAIAEVGAATGEALYERFVQEWVNRLVAPNGRIRTYRMDEYNLDQINPGKVLFPFYRQTGEARYRLALQLLGEQLKRQPRTKSGGFWHKVIYPHQMWLDGIYMAAPFYAEYASVFHEPSGFDEVTHQILLIEEHTRNPRTGLLYHAWDESRQQRWANPETGCSPHFWGRGMGWFAMAIVDVLDHLPEAHNDRPKMIAIFERLSQALVRVQDAATGLWYQVLDQAGQPGNYQEASASAMCVYAFAKGVRKGFLPPDYLSAARRAYRGLLERQIKVDAQGLLTLEGTCGVAGLGGQPYRDGSYTYYVNEKIVTNDHKGVGAFILAALEMEAAGITMHHAE